ncbi:hypothetical protein LCGC14_0485020 [marine sediment metagenome]|uniref:Uncharacterized protein n=1 Tax=marine sediment metagenome TaxID=412755 RepID=A0A0F9SDL2_9ZZZZ
MIKKLLLFHNPPSEMAAQKLNEVIDKVNALEAAIKMLTQNKEETYDECTDETK